MKTSKTNKIFLIIIVILVLWGCYLIYRPFFNVLVMAMVFVAISYKPYLKLTEILKGRKKLAAFLLCLSFLIIIILAIFCFSLFFYKQIADLDFFKNFNATENTLHTQENTKNVLDFDLDEAAMNFFKNKNYLTPENESILRKYTQDIEEWLFVALIPIAGNFINSLMGFLITIPLILITMFFFYIDGRMLLRKLMILTPFPNKYDQVIYEKFHDVSYSIIVSMFVIALMQGILGAIGFYIIGFSVFIGFISIGFASLIPYVGTFIVWVPLGIYLIFNGETSTGIFLLLYGLIIIHGSDLIIRPYMIKGKAEVPLIFIFFALLGGISVFGFWGILYGPLIAALTITIFQIYETEFSKELEK